MVERLMTPQEAADRLVVSTKAVREWLRTRRLKGVKVGRLWRIRESDLEAFLVEPDAPGASRERE